MAKLLGGLLTVVLVAALVMLFLGSVTARFNLITVHPAFWLFTIGILLLLGGGWLASQETPGGAFFAGLGTILLALGGYKAIWPNTSAASSSAQAILDTAGAAFINEEVGYRQIPCDSSTQPPPKFFDPVTSEPRIWVAKDKKTGRIECFNKPGFHTLTRQPLIPVDANMALIIMEQEPLVKPPPPVFVIALPTPPLYATPPPRELGEGLIADLPVSEGGEAPDIPSASPTPTPR